MAITPNAARRISQAVTTVERSIGSGSKLGLDPTTNHSSVIVKTPSGGIPARSGTTLGSASCTIQVVDKSNDSISDGSSIDVLNLSTTAVAGTTYINAIRDRAGNFVADLSGGGGDTIDKASTDANTYGTTSFSTATTETKEITTGAANSTDEAIFGTSGYRPQVGGTYHVAVNILIDFNATSLGSIGTCDTGVPEAPTVDIHLIESGLMQCSLYLNDTAGALASGTLLDRRTIGGQYGLLPDDGSSFTAPSFAWEDKRFVTLEKIFGISQATLNALTGGEAIFKVEGVFTDNGSSGTGTASAQATYTCTYIDSEFSTGDLVSVTPAEAP